MVYHISCNNLAGMLTAVKLGDSRYASPHYSLVVQCQSVIRDSWHPCCKRNSHHVKLSFDVQSLGVIGLKFTWHSVGSCAAQNMDNVGHVVGCILFMYYASCTQWCYVSPCILRAVCTCFQNYANDQVCGGKAKRLGHIYLDYHTNYCQGKIHFSP